MISAVLASLNGRLDRSVVTFVTFSCFCKFRTPGAHLGSCCPFDHC